MPSLSLPPESLKFLLQDAVDRDLVTARRFLLLRILNHESYLTRDQLIVRVEAFLGRNCFGKKSWRDTFYRDMRVVKEAFYFAGLQIAYSRQSEKSGYFLVGQPSISDELKQLNQSALAEIDKDRMKEFRNLTIPEKVQIAFELSDAAIKELTNQVRQQNPDLSEQEAQKIALQREYEREELPGRNRMFGNGFIRRTKNAP